MFNEAQKQRYIEDIQGKYAPEYLTNLRSLFNKTEKIESVFGKDLCEFSHEDISNLYSFITYSDEYIYSNANSRLSAYCEWCLNQSLVTDGCNHYKEFVFNDFTAYVDKSLEKRKFLDRGQLYRLLDDVANYRDKFLMLAIFELGKSDHYEEILSMKLEDIDEEKLEVRLCTGRVAKVTPKFVEIAKEAAKEEKYFFIISEICRVYAPSEYIFKRVAGGAAEKGDKSIDNKLIAKIIKSNVDLHGRYIGISAASLAVSGQFEMIRDMAKNLGIPKEEVILKHFDELKAQYRMSPDNARTYLKKYGAYL